jgi:hypothetical protein
MKYDIFISYRRIGGYDTAKHLYDLLTRDGYNVSFDIDTFKQGDFEIESLKRIDECTDFILILNKEVFDKCLDSGIDKKDDRLRTELAYALEKKKNIIPVMLEGFNEFPRNLPDDISEISTRNGPLFNRFFFNEFYSKLKKDFLQTSKYRIDNKLKIFFIIVPVLLSVIIGVFLLINSNEYSYFTKNCSQQIELMSMGIIDINNNLLIAKSARDEWFKFQRKLSGANPKDIPKIKQEFVNFTETQKKSVSPVSPEYKISDEAAITITRYTTNIFSRYKKVDVNDIRIFYSEYLPKNRRETIEYLEQLVSFTNEDSFFNITDEFVDFVYQYLEANGKLTYYGFLEILNTMPKAVKENSNFYQMHVSFGSFSEISVNLEPDEYAQMGYAIGENIRNLVMKMGSILNTADIDVQKLEFIIENIEREFSIKNRNNEEIKFEEQNELQNMEEQLEMSFRNIIEQCKLASNDNQYLMWGKIVRIATVMSNTVARRQINTNFEFIPKYTLTLDEVLKELIARLDQYAVYFPDTNNYIPTVKQFYTDVKNGKQTLYGIVMIGTKDDIKHPLFIPGDIILFRKGKKINNFSDYNNAVNETGNDTVVFLRLNNGELQRHSEILPKTDLLTGFLVLKEELTTSQ